MDDIIVKHPSFGFDFIPAGTIPPNPGELIRSEKLTELLETMRQRYDFIVIDTSPVGIVPDALSLIEQTDTTLFIVRCMQTNKVFAKQTLESLALNHSNKINLVLSDIPTKKSRFSYGYGYGSYGYNYGSGYGYGYGYGSYGYGKNKKSHKYGRLVDYYRHKFSKTENQDPYKYIDDDDEA